MKIMDTTRILIVDDQIHALQGLSRIMTSAGYQTFEANNGEDCLKLAAEHKPDLILLDVVLPDIDGREVCRRIKSNPETADIHVVLLSSIHIESDSQAEGLEHGADGYIARPIPNRELLARVKSILRLIYAENQLRQSEELFRAMFENHYAIMLLIEPEGGKIVNANHAAEQFYGYTVSQLCSMYIGEINILPPEELEAFRSLAIKNQQNHFVFPHRLASGEIRTVEVYSAPIKQNRKTVIFSIIHDITERKHVEDQLRQSEERFRNFLNASTDLVFIKDEHYRYLFVNKANRDFFGLSEQEIIGKTDLELMPQEAAYTCQQSDQLAIATNDLIVTEEQIDDNFYEIRKFPILLGPKAGIGGIIREITEQRRNQAALKENEELFRGIFEFSPAGKSLTSPEGKLLMVNKAFADMLGYTVEELQRMDFSDITVQEDLPASRECIRSLLSGERNTYRMEKRYISKNGIIVWVDLTTTLFRNPKGTPLYFLTTVLDITYRKQAEDTLKESEFRFGRAELIAGLGNWEIDLSTKKVTASDGARRIYGVGQQELTLDDIRTFPLPEYRSLLDEALHALIKDGGPYDTEFKMKRANDDQVVAIHSIAHYDPEKNSVFGTIHDITNLRNAEESYRLLFAAIEQAAEGVIITDATGMIQYVNPAEEAITGYSRDELIGRKANIFKRGKQDDNFYRSLWQPINAGNIWSGSFINKKKDGTEYHEDATISPVHNKSGKLTNFVALKRDVTKQIELQRQLFQAQKMEAVGTLAGGVAHDFNNLLQAVLGYSELILLSKKEGEPDYANLQKIYQSGKRGADLVKSLMTFSRKVETKYVPVDLNHEITSVRDLLFRTIPKTIRIDLRLSGSLESIKADQSQIGQVLMNLGVNARDAMPDGGTLTIQTSNIQLDDEYCSAHLEAKPGSYALLTVSDTGQGMDKETLSHIFEPFFTTKGKGKGTGLGLATVYGIVKQHGGQISCYSEPGIGTTFTIYLPAIQTEQEVAPPTSETIIPSGTETVLLVDDEDDIKSLGVKLINNFGYKVITANDGKEALEIYQRGGERISLIILDLIMPVMDGRQCLGEILRINPNAKVIMASGYSENGPAKGVMEAGAKGFIQKPYKMRELLTKIREVLDAD